MNEVSCHVFEVFEQSLEAKGVPLSDIVKGTKISVTRLKDRKERIAWAEFVAIMKNLRPHFSDEEYVAIGHAHMNTPGLRFAAIIARLAMTPIDLYRWFNQPRKGLGNQMFTCIVPRYQEISTNQIELELTLPEGFEMCWDFFVITRGNIEQLPHLFGLPRANVVLTGIPRGGRFDVTIPTSRVPVLKQVRRWLERPFTARAAARELKEAHETLTEVQLRKDEIAARLKQAEELSTLAILTSGLAHEIRNPANGIVNAIEPLVEQLPKELVGPETGPGQLLEVMSGCAEQLSALSRELLGFKHNQKLNLSPANLTDVVKRAIYLARGALTGVEVRTSYAHDRQVECSSPLLAQALMNLVENSGHAVGPGGWVQVSTKAAGQFARIEVTDSGPGVPVELRERIFEPFFTTKAPGVGTGLGMSVARAIVQLHGGVLEIREIHGRTTFVIELASVVESGSRDRDTLYRLPNLDL